MMALVCNQIRVAILNRFNAPCVQQTRSLCAASTETEPRGQNITKNLHWTTLKNTSGTLWESKDENEEGVSFDYLKTDFATKAPKNIGVSKSATRDAKPAIVSLLDPKRTQNLGLLVARMWKGDFSDLAAAILRMDIATISAQTLEQLGKNLPTQEEVASVGTYEGEPKYLNKADKFVAAVGQVPQLQARVDSMLFKTMFSEMHQPVKNQVDTILRASNEMRGCAPFQRFLKLLLKAGNVLNQGTRNEGAQGIQLSGLTKLIQTKNNSGVTFLETIVTTISQNDDLSSILDFYGELNHIADASKINVATLTQELAKMRKGFTIIKSQLDRERKSGAETSFEDCFGASPSSPFAADGLVRCMIGSTDGDTLRASSSSSRVLSNPL